MNFFGNGNSSLSQCCSGLTFFESCCSDGATCKLLTVVNGGEMRFCVCHHHGLGQVRWCVREATHNDVEG